MEILRAGAGPVTRLLAFPRPVLSVCTGYDYPAGAFLLLASDVRLALAGEFRIGLDETAIGLTLPHFVLELTRHRSTPPGFARIAGAQMCDPEEAARLGYVDRAYGADALDAAVRAEAKRLRGLDAASFTATEARIHERAIATIEATVDAELRTAGESGAIS